MEEDRETLKPTQKLVKKKNVYYTEEVMTDIAI